MMGRVKKKKLKKQRFVFGGLRLEVTTKNNEF